MINKNSFVWFAMTTVVCLAGCSEEWDDHFEKTQTPISNNQLEIINKNSMDYLAEREDLSSMYGLLKEYKVDSILNAKQQLHTLLVVDNDAFTTSGVETEDPTALQKLAFSHVSDIAISPANLYDGERIMMWHKKMITVGLVADSLLTDSASLGITFGGNAVKEIVKTTDGYVYVIDNMIHTPMSLKDLIDGLDENYSIFQEWVLSSGGKEFDKINSQPIGVDATGNTVYDTTWIYTNDFFDSKNFSLESEALTATVLIFSNDVINKAMAVADSTLAVWDVERDREKLRDWILEVAFYNQEYKLEDLTSPTGELVSIYNRLWRTDVQHIDEDRVEKVSNGIAYYVKDFRIPNNVLIYRLKDFFHRYEYCTAAQKEEYFAMTNMVYSGASVAVSAWSPEPGVWPTVENKLLTFKHIKGSSDGFTMDFTPIRLTKDEDGANIIKPYLVPPGTYRLALGFKQSLNLNFTVSVLVNDNVVATGEVSADGSTNYHYDRGNSLDDTYPEGYAEVMGEIDATTEYGKKKDNYDTDGGMGIAEVVIPDVKGDGSPTQIVIRFENTTLSEDAKCDFHHWCLRPAASNY